MKENLFIYILIETEFLDTRPFFFLAASQSVHLTTFKPIKSRVYILSSKHTY